MAEQAKCSKCNWKGPVRTGLGAKSNAASDKRAHVTTIRHYRAIGKRKRDGSRY